MADITERLAHWAGASEELCSAPPLLKKALSPLLFSHTNFPPKFSHTNRLPRFTSQHNATFFGEYLTLRPAPPPVPGHLHCQHPSASFAFLCCHHFVELLCIFRHHCPVNFSIIQKKDFGQTITFKMPKAVKRATKKDAKDKKRGPKRGLSAYMFFANEQRENVRAENPNITFGQVGKVLGERWKALNDKQRVPYEAKAAADKKRYEDEKAAFQASEQSGLVQS
ncbi:hypothetical protein E4U26_007130 [Claviceps purpurea]|nr:hypothetical protein E4U26_007130 [Claviceps purpurea]